jgi:hypothetical protein
VGARGAYAIARLSKTDVERLLDHYDLDPVGALTDALRVALDMPTADLATLVDTAGLDPAVLGDVAARDALARDLNELRELPRR